MVSSWRLESDFLQVDVAPGVGGRIVGLRDKPAGHEFLWRNSRVSLRREAPGSAYDPNFYGGIDELLPNDVPETVGGQDWPDHGELWTTPLEWRVEARRLHLWGTLPMCRLVYQRQMSLRADGPWLDLQYRIVNPTAGAIRFLWKLHAALPVAAGDEIDCPARWGRVADLAWSRYDTLAPFPWPIIRGQEANRAPAKDGTADFFYLWDLAAGQMGWKRRAQNRMFAYHFDTRVFPCAAVFASYGGFEDHYTAILEPCTAIPSAVSETAAERECPCLRPGEALETTVSIYAGPIEPQDGRLSE
jgi:hypothetical protein